MAWFVPLITAAASGIANAISGSSQAEQDRKNRAQATAMLKEGLVSDEDLRSLLQKNTKMFNTSLTNLLNTTALKTRGVANAPVVGATVASNLEGQKLQSALDIEQNVMDRNQQITSQIASLSLGAQDSDPVGDFFSGAIGGATAGLELSKYVDGLSKLDSTGVTPTTPQVSETSSLESLTQDNPTGVTGKPNPYIDYLGGDQFSSRLKELEKFGSYIPDVSNIRFNFGY